MKRLMVILFALFMVVVFVGGASAETASWTNATAYTDSTPKDADDTFSVTLYEGGSPVAGCANVTPGTQCTITVQCSPFGQPLVTHTYVAKTNSSKYGTTSSDSNTATYDAPSCPAKTPVAPTLLQITIN